MVCHSLYLRSWYNGSLSSLVGKHPSIQRQNYLKSNVSTQLCLSISEREFTIFEVPSTHPYKLIFAKSIISEELGYCQVFHWIFYHNKVGFLVLAILPSMIKNHLVQSQHRIAVLTIVQQVSVAKFTRLVNGKNRFEYDIIYSEQFTFLLSLFYWPSSSFWGHCWQSRSLWCLCWQSRSLWCLCWWRGCLCLKICEFWYENWLKELTIILTRDWNCGKKA